MVDQNPTSPPALAAEVISGDKQVEVVWAMGLASLDRNKGEIVLPLLMASCLSGSQVEDLKLRLR